MDKAEDLYSEARLDTIAQPLRDWEFASICADLLQHMTGEECDIVPRHTHYWIVRNKGDKWIRA